MGEDITPTLISRYETQIGNTQDKLNVICLNDQGGAQMDVSKDRTATLRAQMHGHPPAVVEREVRNAGTSNTILRILQKAYGEKAVEEWGIAILAALQSPEILRQRMYEGCVPSETENGNELDDNSLPRPSVVTEWLLRDMREQQECGCASQGRESIQQRSYKFTEIMSKLPPESTQAAQTLFDMWQEGQGVWLLRQALSEIQKIRKPDDGEEQSVYRGAIVRRLTPLEAERLQGYPDHWTDIGEWVDSKGKTHKDADSPRYKALGNSIALPFWEWMAKRMVEKLKEEGVEEPTMASLFDGIGGFPLVYQRAGCKPVWASEIEEFPIAVTKRRFPE